MAAFLKISLLSPLYFLLFKIKCSLHGRLASWRKWRACDVGEAKEGLKNEVWRCWSNGRVGEWALLNLQPFRHFTYVTAHSPTLTSLYLVTAHSPTIPLLHLSHSSFSNPTFASPTSKGIQLIHLASRPWFTYTVFKTTVIYATSVGYNLEIMTRVNI